MGERKDTRNKSDLTRDEYIEAYKKELCDDENISYFIKELINNDCIDFNVGYYWVEDVVKTFNYLDDYLKHNIDNLESYEFASQLYLDARKYSPGNYPENANYYHNHSVIKVCTFNSYFIENPYHIYTDGYPGEIHYVLKDSIRVEDAVNNDIGILCIHAKPNGEKADGTLKIEKDSIENGLFIEETYREDWFSGVIYATVYDIKKAIDRKYINPFDGTKVEGALFNPYPIKREKEGIIGARKPWFVGKDDCIFSVTAYYHKTNNFKPGEYMVEYYDDLGRHNETIYGDSLYSAYYNFMIEKGCFKDNSEKINENLK